MSNSAQQVDVREVAWVEAGDSLRALREQVFIVEQGVPREIEWDGRDDQCRHVMARVDGEPAGCARLMPGGKVGRMAVLARYRGRGIGAALLDGIIAVARAQGYDRLFLHAQQHAAPFYRRAGFEPRGATFEEAGIPHVSMHLDLDMDAPSLELEATGDSFLGGVAYPSPFNRLTLTLAESASRYLYILSPSLDFRVFDNSALEEAITALARRSRQTEIRILIADPRPLVQRGHRLLNLARRLPSKVQLRALAEHPEWRGETLVIRDRDGVLYKPGDSDKEGFYEPDSRASTQRHLELFQELWRQGTQGPELRRLNL
ncbi:GNAT family N-acetyltransferase [Parahaliea mediterranea]|uniref:GNAT family N-acetyltransferase n=1 Tax=Parahaliea mediterranea TaxID=651086 RepID=A0A939DJY0_9GAMM|nr:GNAT family N-acetyltransferase [Parahaliea mediterranea]MBN7798807.1 GNAT family N-acetyltransferase [Parahaliea mediterranea]